MLVSAMIPQAATQVRPRICRKRVGVKWLLQARQRPALDGDVQDEPTQQVAHVVGDHPEEQPHLVGPQR